jgi:uncharacterized protein with von Willebrand factor type A (vWA) domain
MDAGGSMTPYARLVSTLFSAAHGLNHFKDFRHYYFHNCVYEELYADIALGRAEPVAEVLRALPKDYDLVIVGDAYMNPAELLDSGGSIDYWHHNETPGLAWLQKLRDHWKRSVWLNPLPPNYWGAPTVRMIGRVFPMFPLTVAGIEDATAELLRARRVMAA